MNERTFMTSVLAIEDLPDDLATYAREAIAKLDARNEKRKNTPSKAQRENEPIKADILEVLSDKPMLAKEIADAVGISTSKASSLCTQLSIAGLVVVTPTKVKNRGKVNAYTLAPTNAE